MGNTIVCKDIRIPTWKINVTMTKLSKSTRRETRYTKICMILSRFLLKTYSWFQTETLEFLLSPGLTLVSCVLCNDANNTWISIIISSILLYFNFKFIATGSKVSDFFYLQYTVWCMIRNMHIATWQYNWNLEAN